MKDKKSSQIYNTLLKQIIDCFPEEEFLKADGLDEAIIGLEESSMRLIYSKSKVIKALEGQGMTTEDALEFFDFNIQGAYVGEKTPI